MFDGADSPATARSAAKEAGAEDTLAQQHGDAGGAAGEAPRAPGLSEPLWTHVGHELRTPLHAILGNVELLVDGSAGPLTADARACLGDIQNAGRRLLGQVDLVLRLVQAEATPTPGAEDEVDLVERMRAALHRHVGAPEVELRAGRLVLRGDSFWLDTWVSTLVGALPPEAGGAVASRIAIERAADPAPDELGLRIVCAGLETQPPSPVVLMLLDAIARLHGGRILPQTGPALELAWPKSRVVAWQSG